MTGVVWTAAVVLGVCAVLALIRAHHTFNKIIREESPRMTDPAPKRTGIETSTGASMLVTYDPALAETGSPWVAAVDGRRFPDSDVVEQRNG